MNISDKTNDRWEQIVSLVDEFGYLSVNRLSELCHASDITIRRDLGKLSQQNRLVRTHGGAASTLHKHRLSSVPAIEASVEERSSSSGSILEQVDAIITTTHYPDQDYLVTQGNRKNKPVIAEALPVTNMVTCVAIDNYRGGLALGQWAGEYALKHFSGYAKVLDLTYHLSNTEQRSNGFKAGLQKIIPDAQVSLSLNAYSRFDSAYQLTRDALLVDPEINIIFTINDINAWGAISACGDVGIDKNKLIVVSFGLDGNITRTALTEGNYYAASLAMFPELVGPACIEAVIATLNGRTLPPQLITPYAVITRDNLPDYYTKCPKGWELRWDNAIGNQPFPLSFYQPHHSDKLPKKIGVVIRFAEHEWYQNLFAAMLSYGQHYGIELILVDFEQTIKEELELHRREIARCAADQVQSGDVILIDGGPISPYLAEELVDSQNITVISNSLDVLEKLKGHDAITVLSIGGALRHTSHVFVGPTAETTIRELRADKLFLMVTGISPDFGLSHSNISEVTVKQNMIRSAREVILLADHTCFGRESTIQVAPLSSAQKIITDDSLLASSRLELTKKGLQVIVAGMC